MTHHHFVYKVILLLFCSGFVIQVYPFNVSKAKNIVVTNFTPKIILARFKPVVTKLKRKTNVPIVLLVKNLKDNGADIYLHVISATKSEYELSLDKGEDCRGAGACNYGYITGKRSKTHKPVSTANFQFELKRAQKVTLTKGIKGYFIDFTCGANCDSAKIFWVQNGFQYMVGIKAGALEDVVKLANDVIHNQRR